MLHSAALGARLPCPTLANGRVAYWEFSVEHLLAAVAPSNSRLINAGGGSVDHTILSLGLALPTQNPNDVPTEAWCVTVVNPTAAAEAAAAAAAAQEGGGCGGLQRRRSNVLAAASIEGAAGVVVVVVAIGT